MAKIDHNKRNRRITPEAVLYKQFGLSKKPATHPRPRKLIPIADYVANVIKKWELERVQ